MGEPPYPRCRPIILWTASSSTTVHSCWMRPSQTWAWVIPRMRTCAPVAGPKAPWRHACRRGASASRCGWGGGLLQRDRMIDHQPGIRDRRQIAEPEELDTFPARMHPVQRAMDRGGAVMRLADRGDIRPVDDALQRGAREDGAGWSWITASASRWPALTSSQSVRCQGVAPLAASASARRKPISRTSTPS